MSSLNKVMLIGRLGADPETKSFRNGGKVCNLRVATSESWKDRSTGERQERTEWHSVAIFTEGLADIAARYLKKGSQVYLEGQLRTRKWQANDGNDRYTTEVVLQGFGGKLVMLGDAGGGGSSKRQDPPADDRGRGQPAGGWSNRDNDGYDDDLDDDIPF